MDVKERISRAEYEFAGRFDAKTRDMTLVLSRDMFAELCNSGMVMYRMGKREGSCYAGMEIAVLDGPQTEVVRVVH